MLSWVEAALLLLLPVATEAHVFATAPFVREGGGALVCRVTNAGGEGRRVRVEALDGEGLVTLDSGPFRLAAGASYLSGGGVDARRCRFTVLGNVRGVRAHGLLLSPQGGALSLPPEAVR